MSAREEILARIRAAIGGEPRQEPGIPRAYRRLGSLSARERLELFVDRLRDYEAGVHETTLAGISATVAEILSAREKRGLTIPEGIPDGWLPAGFAFSRDQDFSYGQLDQCPGVLTGCTVAVALTGTIVLQSGQAQGRRALTLIPDYHLCVVLESQVVETVPEAIALLRQTASLPTTTISGPSATADIEMTRVKGVHGPRTLDVIVAV